MLILKGVKKMNFKSLGYFAFLCAVLLFVCTASAVIPGSSPTIDRNTVIHKITAGHPTSSLSSLLENYYQSSAVPYSEVSVSFDFDSVVLADSWYNEYLASSITCSDCGSTQWSHTPASHTYRFRYVYPYSGQVYYPGQEQSDVRGYGDLIVTGPDDGITYYLWIKSKFFATDINPNYDMRWHYGGIIPVSYEDILAGTYCLKTTTVYDVNADAVWCGTAVVADNRTTTAGAFPSLCPWGCTCC